MIPDEYEGVELNLDRGKYFMRQFSVMEHIPIKNDREQV